jgi:hypothetical protein
MKLPTHTAYPLPTVHLNGTGRKMLQDGYMAAYETLEKATEALAAIEFNARDYYVQEDGAYIKAREERNKMFAHLEHVNEYLVAHLEAVGVG